ncbi:CAMK family protein kinase [Histomonas meleagridis]|uniref:CAMK family protein kinase n=1 Tax=Histomonas meleagridis TaxID=135588 RepID=UPI00355ABD1E|nr:CAMK family protein kinase [Histomonas meleagridis]KAH0799624.1 CAMK family protein kinase [Histomonas meleagridis]
MALDFIGNYELRGAIGEGAFSIVRLALNQTTQKFCACKIIPRSRLMINNLDIRFENEIRINQQLHHPNIVQLIDLQKDEKYYYIIMEFCPNGELFRYVISQTRLKEYEAKIFLTQILEGIKYVHSLGICHRDLKPENLLIDEYGRVKISDFGLSRFVDKNGLVDTPCGSPCYASPECVSGKPYDGRKSDIWSIGVISYAMLTGQLPWTKRNQQQLFEQIRRGEYIIPNYLSEQCRNFIQGLMTVDCTRRLTVDLALAHPWIRGCQVPLLMPTYVNNMISLQQVDLFFDRDESDSSLKSIEIEESPSMEMMDFDTVMNIIAENGEIYYDEGDER